MSHFLFIIRLNDTYFINSTDVEVLFWTVRHPQSIISQTLFFPSNKVTQGPSDNDVFLYDNDSSFNSLCIGLQDYPPPSTHMNISFLSMFDIHIKWCHITCIFHCVSHQELGFISRLLFPHNPHLQLFNWPGVMHIHMDITDYSGTLLNDYMKLISTHRGRQISWSQTHMLEKHGVIFGFLFSSFGK